MIQIGAPASTLDTPIEHLSACHRRIEQRLDTFIRAAAHLETDRERALAAIEHSIRFLDTSGVLHTEDEEGSLFPRLRPRLSPEELTYVDSLESQHDEAEAIYARLKELIARLAGPAVTPELVHEYLRCAESLQSLYGAHIRSEDEILTRLAKTLLAPGEIAEITGEMRERRSR